TGPRAFAGRGVVASGEPRRLGHQFSSTVTFVDRRRRPGGDFLAGGAPLRAARRDVECGDERTLLNVALHDHRILPDDRRAGDSPLVIWILEPPGIQRPQRSE